MSSPDTQGLRERLADGFQSLADKDTAFRYDNADSIGGLVALTSPEWSVTIAVAGAIVSDKTDGFWATIAKKVRGYDVPTAGGEDDPKADHKLLENLLGGLMVRASRLDDQPTVKFLTDQLRRNHDRNGFMDQHRERIRDFGLDKTELRANGYNKAKMTFQAFGCLALSTPWSRYSLFRLGSRRLIALGTKSGEVGERKFAQKVDDLIALSVIPESSAERAG